MSALAKLLRAQLVSYDFQYYKMDVQVDFPAVILSNQKSVLPADCIVKLQDHSPTEHSRLALSENELAQIRVFLQTAKNTQVTFSEEVNRVIEEDFVKTRQKEENFSSNHLHYWIILAKSLALSQGTTTLTPAIWEQMKSLEAHRMARL